MTPIDPADQHPESLDETLIDAISSRALTDPIDSQPKARPAATTFLYLYMMLAHGEERYVRLTLKGYERHDITDSRPSFNFTARSTLPVGAGLGSSASFSTCAATALLLLNQRIAIPPQPRPSFEPAPGSSQPIHIHVSHQGRRAIPPATAEEVNRWAFVAEKILHGNPSGVDNSVAVFGGAVAYTRAGFGRKSGMEPIQG